MTLVSLANRHQIAEWWGSAKRFPREHAPKNLAVNAGQNPLQRELATVDGRTHTSNACQVRSLTNGFGRRSLWRAPGGCVTCRQDPLVPAIHGEFEMMQYAVMLRCSSQSFLVSLHSGDTAEQHARDSADVVAGHPRPTTMRMKMIYGVEPTVWVGVDIVWIENGLPVSVVNHHRFGSR